MQVRIGRDDCIVALDQGINFGLPALIPLKRAFGIGRPYFRVGDIPGFKGDYLCIHLDLIHVKTDTYIS